MGPTDGPNPVNDVKAGKGLSRWSPAIVVGLATMVFAGAVAGFVATLQREDVAVLGDPDRLSADFDVGDTHFLWVFTASLTVTIALTLLIPTLTWRRQQSHEYLEPPALGNPWAGARTRLNFLVPVAFALGGSYLELTLRRGAFDTTKIVVSSLPTLVSWIIPLLAMASMLDVHTIATHGADQFLPITRTQEHRLNRLRTFLDRYLAVLGAQIAAWVLWKAVDSGNTDKTMAIGGFLTGLLALAYLPTASAVDRLASTMLETKSEILPWDSDFMKAKQLRDAYRVEIGLDQTIRERFAKGLYVAAPLLTALFTSITGLKP